ncbi:hypothetical protein [Carboxylicivirga caseinilyticus]|uniref:hypothetical protein n=1 Tax=Carboxylicivirga caseinilyticus TaxID=3417572 RepID=UPI003D333A05|nr:hypothetical protein [Marinilabiliaceae bacterium A049]
MTDRLKDFIENNADGFNDLEVPKESWDKIATRLGHSKKSNSVKIRYISIIAAACIAGIAVFMVVFNNTEQPTSQLAEVPEIVEAEAYYTSQINVKREQVYQLAGGFPELKEEMEIDLAELDTIMVQLKKDLNDNVSNEEVIEAMIQNYRMKLMILEDIKSFLEEKNEKPKNTKSYEL